MEFTVKNKVKSMSREDLEFYLEIVTKKLIHVHLCNEMDVGLGELTKHSIKTVIQNILNKDESAA